MDMLLDEISPVEIFGKENLRNNWEKRSDERFGITIDDILNDERFNIRNIKRDNAYRVMFFGRPQERVMFVLGDDELWSVGGTYDGTLWNESGERTYSEGELFDIIPGVKETYIAQRTKNGVRVYDRNGNVVFGGEHEPTSEHIWETIDGGKAILLREFYFATPDGKEFLILEDGVYRKDGQPAFCGVDDHTYNPIRILEKDNKMYIEVDERIIDELGNKLKTNNKDGFKLIREIKW